MYSNLSVKVLCEIIFLLIINFVDQIKSSEVYDNSTLEKSPRFLRPYFFRPSILNIVRFPNDECFDASNQSGTCYTALECKKIGGVPSSPCARGLGSCCIVSRSCHNSTSHKVVYFKNPSYPQSDTQQNFCDLTVNIIDPDICQLRLDFLDFQLDQPFQGECLGDKFTISASGFSPTSVPTLCGLNRNQHMYVSLPKQANGRSASIVFITDNVGDYRWHVRITQINCNYRGSKNLLSDRNQRAFGTKFGTLADPFADRSALYSTPAPSGCLQYFTAPSGIVESFNFGEYLNNLDYAICIERQPNTCRVIYSASDYAWNIDSEFPNQEASGVGDTYCKYDYLNIPAASRNGDGETFDRYCGGKLYFQPQQVLEAPVISKANGPIVLRFHTDAIHKPNSNKDGFRLRYEQSSTECLAQYQNPLLPFNPNQPTPVLAANLVVEHNQFEKRETQGRTNTKQLII